VSTWLVRQAEGRVRASRHQHMAVAVVKKVGVT